jgi:anti-sigma regulatory factor (Ser/Thr protein kinase)
MSPAGPDPRSPHHGDARFTRAGIAADAAGAAQTRVEFGGWLEQQFTLSDERLNDLLLTTYEALANAAEFAYLDVPAPKTIDVHAHYDSGSDCLVVTISDRGRWRQPVDTSLETDPRFRLRGRGIPLMHALADEAAIHTGTAGTQVRLSWHPLQSRHHI